jgi:hypothetical protein
LPEPPFRLKIARVDHSLLRLWLGLPPGEWPPDHYALLGLPPGSGDPAIVERTVLDRMAQLRPHQLLHPELVTEGMNRLAQALVCLTDPAARAIYDAELGLPPLVPASEPIASVVPRPAPPPLPQPPYEVIPGFPIPTDEDAPSPDMTQIIEVSFPVGLLPPKAVAPAYEVVEDKPSQPKVLPYEIVPDFLIEADLINRAEPPWQPATRRQLYTRLTRLRRLLATWQKLKLFFDDPQEPLDRPMTVLLLLEVVRELQPLLDCVPLLIGDPWRPGGLVVALIRQPLFLHNLRSLLPDQRQAVTLDWQRGEGELSREYARLRELSRSGRPFRRHFPRRGRLMRTARWAMRNPESLLVGLALAILLLVLLRSPSSVFRIVNP